MLHCERTRKSRRVRQRESIGRDMAVDMLALVLTVLVFMWVLISILRWIQTRRACQEGVVPRQLKNEPSITFMV